MLKKQSYSKDVTKPALLKENLSEELDGSLKVNTLVGKADYWRNFNPTYTLIE